MIVETNRENPSQFHNASRLKMYLTCLQGRVPAWNLAGLLPPDPTSPGPGGPSPGAVSTPGSGIAHPLPHYSGAYGGHNTASHYTHLLPQSSEHQHQWPPSMEHAVAVSEATAAAMHYKMDPDAMLSMYYPPLHQVDIFSFMSIIVVMTFHKRQIVICFRPLQAAIRVRVLPPLHL